MDRKIRKNKKAYTYSDMYYNYTKKYGENIDYLHFKRILEEFNNIILHELQDASQGFKMPYALGYLQIVKYKPKHLDSKSLSQDYEASKQYGKRIYHLNEHSNGYKYRLYWSKCDNHNSMLYKYNISFVRDAKRRLAQLIFNNNDYINIDDLQVYKM